MHRFVEPVRPESRWHVEFRFGFEAQSLGDKSPFDRCDWSHVGLFHRSSWLPSSEAVDMGCLSYIRFTR